MGTLTWTVWLLLAITALASDVEVGAAPDQETDVAGGKQHSDHPGYVDGGKGGDDSDDHDDGGKQGHGHKNELSKKQKNILKKILKYLKLRLESAKGEIAFNGHRISIDFILTAVIINGGDIHSLTVADLWEIIQLYEAYEKKLGSESQNRNISRYEDVTLLYVTEHLRNHPGVTGKIVIDGVEIPVIYILLQLKLRGEDIHTLTTGQLRPIVWDYVSRANSIPLIPIPLGKQPTQAQITELDIIIDFLKTQGSNATGSFVFNGYRVSIRFILRYLAQHGLNVKNLTAQELWAILHAYVNEIDQLNKLPAKEKTDLRNILKYLKFLGDGATGEIMFNGKRISVDFILTVVLLQDGDIHSITVEDLWEIIQLYEIYENKLGNEPQNRNISRYEQVTLLYVITYLRNHEDVTGEIVIDGVKIPVSYILNQLKIHGQDIRNVTIQQLYKIIDAYITGHNLTPAPLGKQPTEEQKIELKAIIDFLKAQRSNAVGSFIISGHRISLRFILNYLAQHGLNVKNLTTQELWRIIHAYVNEIDQLNKLPAKDKTDLRNILKYLKFLGDGATGEITFNGTRISVDFILTVALLQGGDIHSLTVADLWEIIQLYEVYEKKLGNEPQNRNISRYEDVTLLYVTEHLRNHPGVTGKIVIDGVEIPVIYILLQLKLRGEDIHTLTTGQLRPIVWAYVSRSIGVPLIPIPLGKQPTQAQITELDIIINYLKTQGSNATGSFVFNGYRVSIRFILRYLAQRGLNVKNLTAQELWAILHAYVNEIDQLNKLPAKEKTDLRNIVKYLKFLGDGATGEITFNGTRISVDFILTVALLQGADIHSLTVADLWEIIKLYEVYEKKLESEPQNRNISKDEQVTLLYVITYLRNHENVTGEIAIDGVKIPVSYILKQLKTHGQDIRNVTIEQLYKIIEAFLNTYTPPTPVPLGKQPTEEQTFELKAIIDFLKTQGNNATGSFIFSGYKIPVQFILNYLAQHGLNVKNLTAQELWRIILLYASTEGNTTTEVTGTGSVGTGSGTTGTGEGSGTGSVGTGSGTTGTGEGTGTESVGTGSGTTGTGEGTGTGSVGTGSGTTGTGEGTGTESVGTGSGTTGTGEGTGSVGTGSGTTGTGEGTGTESVGTGSGTTGTGEGTGTSSVGTGSGTTGTGEGTGTSSVGTGSGTTGTGEGTGTSSVGTGSGTTGTGEGTGTSSVGTGSGTTGTGEGTGTSSVGTGSGTTGTGEGTGTSSVGTGSGTTGTGEGTGTSSVGTGSGTTGTGEGTGTSSVGTGSWATETTTSEGGTVTTETNINVTLHRILEEILSEGINATGYVEFGGRNISVQFILTALSLKHIDVRNATAADIYNILLLYLRYAESAGSNEEGVPKDEIVTLLAILQYLRTNKEGDNGNFTFDGYKIPIQFIAEIIKAQNVSFNNLTISELYLILEIYIAQEKGSITVDSKPPSGVIASLEEVLQILKAQGDNATGAVEISGYIIPFQYIELILKARGIDAQNVSQEELWLITELYIEFQQQSGKPQAGPQAVLKFFIEILSNTESVNNSILVVDGHSVSISEIVSALGLKVDNSTGKFDTANLTTTKVLRAVLEVIGKQGAPTEPPQTAHGKDELLNEFLQVISNPDIVANTVIVYNGQQISAQALVSALGLHIDSATGKYDTNSLTADQLFETIQQFVSTTQNATT